MRAVVQRVREARVTVDDELIASIGEGLVVLLGVKHGDNSSDVQYLVDKIANLRVFEDDNGKMNLSVLELSKEVLVVSQFTLYGDCRKGRRPSFTEAAEPTEANALYQQLVEGLTNLGLKVQTGQFQARMLVEIFNDGPVTLLLDSSRMI
ncbi:MAG: D-tyrosyl-tRNA(Tyr) deacylase [Syntrophomonadaceae bacterium]|nr:D-tyrosyl-tRNA(Tyr) deacylase [Syntrophomonadaceae bacterium]